MQSSYEVQLPTLALEAPHKTLGQRYYGHRLVGADFVIYTPDSVAALPAGRYRVTPIRGHARREHGLVVGETVAAPVTAQFEASDADRFELPFGRVALWCVAVADVRSSIPTTRLLTIHDQAPPQQVVLRPTRMHDHALVRVAQRLRVTRDEARGVLQQLMLSAGLAPASVVARHDVKPPAAALWTAEHRGKRVLLYTTADGVVLTAFVEAA